VSIKAKQVAGVTTLVVVIVAILSGYHISRLSHFLLEESASRAELISRALFHRANGVVLESSREPYVALREDGGIRSILLASILTQHISYAAIVDPDGIAVAHALPARVGTHLEPQRHFAELLEAGPYTQLRAIFDDQTFEVHEDLLADDAVFGSIRIGVSTLLVRAELRTALERAISIALLALLVSSLVAMMLAQWMLRPIHVIQSGLSRLGRGELDVSLDLPEQEFKDLGSSFQAVSAQLAAVGRGAPTDGEGALRTGAGTDYESVMDNLEDAVALFSPHGEVIFSNAAMRALGIAGLPASHPVRQLVDRTLSTKHSAGPVAMPVSAREVAMGNGSVAAEPSEPVGDPDAERLLMCHAIEDTNGRFVGAMLVARNLAYLNQVHSTLNYSRKAAALGRLLAGVAHEVKNPLNAMTIHLELLKQKLAVYEPVVVPAGAGPEAGRSADLTKHVGVIASEIKRLDEVVAGFLKFARPEELRLQPIALDQVIHDVVRTITPEAHRRRVAVREDCASSLPDINADQGMLTQAVLNLAINALQAMPDGGTLRIGCRQIGGRRVELVVEDTGVGIAPEYLPRVFDLYFTTKEKGSGIGLSMVFRIVQLHDGEIEVQSTPGAGTTFRLKFPQT
jgi:signal transduction histidine kinase